MSAPRGFAGAVLALWGASNGFAALGIVMGVVLEALRFTKPPPALARSANLVRAIQASVFLVAAGLVYAVAAGRIPDSLYAWLRWLPVMLLPLPLAASLAGGTIPGGAFLEAMRAPRTVTIPPRNVDVMFGYAAATLVAAGTGARIEQWFYAAAIGLVAWALVVRMPQGRRVAGVVMIALAATLGYGVHRGLSALQGRLEELDPSILLGAFQPDPDPFRERTRIGDMGRIKLDDRIVMRVFPEGPRPSPLLLREAAFDRYHGGEWQSSNRTFQAVPREGDRWIISEGPATAAISVRRTMASGEGLLALPAGSRAVDSLPAESVEALPTGAVRAKGTPRFVTMRVSFDELDAGATGPADTSVPEELWPLLDNVIAGEHLRGASDRETVAAIERFFSENFTYSLFLAATGSAASRTLSDFLLRDRKGHCEYFATSTVLLLRRAGVPALYTVGYSAQEYSSLEKAFVVRSRHAHAWTRARVDGRWITVDTTPSRWALDEEEAAHGFFAPLLDRASWAIDRIVQWWVEGTMAGFARSSAIFVAVVLAPFAIMAMRRGWRARAAKGAADAQHPATKAWRGVEAALAKRGLVRASNETALAWSHRLRDEARGEAWGVELVELARAYYRARFDPSAPASVIEEFAGSARRWSSADAALQRTSRPG